MKGRVSQKSLYIAGLEVALTRKKIKNLHLRVSPPDGDVRVSAPYFVSEKAIGEFVLEKITWIKQQQSLISARPSLPDYGYNSGEAHYFLGRRYPLNWQPNRKLQGLVNNEIHLHCASNASENDRANILREWYRQQIKQLIPLLLQKWQAVVKKEAKDWGVKNMKTKWGSCNIRDARIWLNLALVKYPLQCLEYVIVHELVHLYERYHNARFYALMDTFMPEWREAKKILDTQPDLGRL